MKVSATAIAAIFFAGLLTGAAVVAAVSTRSTRARSPELRHPLQVRLHRMEILDDKLARYDDWQRFLHQKHDAAVATLAREHMYVEAMFRDPERDPHVLYWLEVRDDAGAHVDSSKDPVDIEHIRYMDEVLRKGSHSVLATDNVLVAPFVQVAIAANQARDAAKDAHHAD